MIIDTDKVVTVSDIADMAGVSSAAVSNWQKRHDDFPPAMMYFGRVGIWEMPTIIKWLYRHDKVTAE